MIKKYGNLKQNQRYSIKYNLYHSRVHEIACGFGGPNEQNVSPH